MKPKNYSFNYVDFQFVPQFEINEFLISVFKMLKQSEYYQKTHRFRFHFLRHATVDESFFTETVRSICLQTYALYGASQNLSFEITPVIESYTTLVLSLIIKNIDDSTLHAKAFLDIASNHSADLQKGGVSVIDIGPNSVKLYLRFALINDL
ncbi:hypothetical protein GOQ04_23000 [Emticicia sp. ODNR4P]|nr:hypothetical protein [Emticicia sp. ODNR4P]